MAGDSPWSQRNKQRYGDVDMRGWLQRALLAISRNFILCSIHEDLWWLRSFMTWNLCRTTTTKLSLARRKIQDWHVLTYTSFELFSKYCVELSSGRYIQDNALIWMSNDSGSRVGYMSIILMYHTLFVDCEFQTTVFKQGIIVPVIFRSIYRYEPCHHLLSCYHYTVIITLRVTVWISTGLCLYGTLLIF